MNTVKSFWLGWGSLCVAGGGAYYFAKKQINAERVAKLDEQRRRKLANESLEYGSNVPNHPMSSSTMGGGTNGNGTGPARTDTAGSPSQESSTDPAPTGHAPVERSKYESSTPFVSKKGDRFS